MIGWIFGGAILAAFIVIAISRPLTVRTAMGYAWAARKQMIPVVLGLSAITAILGAAEIIEDSAVEGVKQSYLSPLNLVDGQVQSWYDGITEEQTDAFLAQPGMDAIRDVTPVRIGQNAVEGPYGLGTDSGQFWAVDPTDYQKFVNFEVLDGAIPNTWGQTTAVVDQLAASELGVEAGDALTVYIGARPQKFLNETPFEGSFDVVTPRPVTVGMDVDEIPSQSVLVWEGEVGPEDWLLGDTEADPEILEYRLVGPNGQYSPAVGGDPDDPAQPDWRIYGWDEYIGHWQVYIEAKSDAVGTDVSYEGNVVLEGERTPPSRVELLKVAAIVDDANTPLSWGGTILVNEAHSVELFGFKPIVQRLLLDLDDDIDHIQFSAQLEQAVDRTIPSAWGVDFHHEVAVITAEIERYVGPMFAAFGSLSIIAGLILVVVLISLIVEERRGVLGALRALGGTRSQVQVMVLSELAIVALASVLFGILFAMAFGGSVTALFQTLMEGESEALIYTVKLSSLLDAGGFAFALILGAGWIGARQALKAGPIELLREQPAPSKKRRAWLGRVAWISFALLLSALLALLHPAFALLVGGTAVAITVGIALASAIRWKYLLDVVLIGLFTIILVAMLTQGPGIHDRLYDFDDGGGWRDEMLPMLYPLEAVMLVGLGSAILVRSKLVHGGMVALLSGPLRPMAEMATGNLRDRPGRQGAILAVFAVSLVMITMMGLMFQSFGPTVADDDGGYPVMGQTRQLIDDPEAHLAANPPRSGADPFALSSSFVHAPTVRDWNDFGVKTAQNEYPDRPYAWGPGDIGILLTDDVAEKLRYDAVQLAPEFDSWEDAVHAVQTQRNTIILGGAVEFYISNGDGPGQYRSPSFDMELVTTPRGDGFQEEVHLAAIIPQAGGFSVLMGEDMFERTHHDSDGTRLWFAPASGVTTEELTIAAGSAFRSAGMITYDLEEEAREEQRVALTIQTIMGLFMGMGILVGMLSLGLIAQRTLHQRQGALSVLRAIGATKNRVMASFIVEQVFVVLLAVLLGTTIGLLAGGSMLTALEEGLELKINVAFMLAVLGATLFGGVLVGVLPALRLRRLRIADALRYE